LEGARAHRGRRERGPLLRGRKSDPRSARRPIRSERRHCRQPAATPRTRSGYVSGLR
jgi:hypothetical protein